MDAPAASGDTQAAAPPVKAATVDRAALHAGRVIGALGEDGAEQYSQACYEALRREYSNHRRDRCYAFDLVAARLLEAGSEYLPAYFMISSIRSRWVDDPASSSGDWAEPGERRAEVERLSASVAASPEAPPTSTIPAPATNSELEFPSDPEPVAEPALEEAPANKSQ